MENLNLVTVQMAEYQGEFLINGKNVLTRLIKILFVCPDPKFIDFVKSLLTSVPFKRGLSASFWEITTEYWAPSW